MGKTSDLDSCFAEDLVSPIKAPLTGERDLRLCFAGGRESRLRPEAVCFCESRAALTGETQARTVFSSKLGAKSTLFSGVKASGFRHLGLESGVSRDGKYDEDGDKFEDDSDGDDGQKRVWARARRGEFWFRFLHWDNMPEFESGRETVRFRNADPVHCSPSRSQNSTLTELNDCINV